MLLWFVFVHLVKLRKCFSLKNACFSPVCWAFVGWLILVYLGFEGLGVFVFLVLFYLA